jgi:hypothetical protein
LTILAPITHNVPAVTDVFFAPDKEKCEAFLRAQKNVAEQNTTKGVSPTGVLRNLTAERRRTVTVLLGEVWAYLIFNLT